MTMPVEPPATRALLRILLVDDEPVDRLAVRRCLLQSGLRANVVEAATATETLEKIRSAPYDCLLLDYYLPGTDGVVLVRQVREAMPHVPVVMFTGRGDEEIAVELMKAGAVDYVPKASLTPERIASSVRHAMELAEAAAARQRAEDELREQESRFRTLANAIPQLAWTADASGGRFWFNQRWFDYTGMTPEDVQGDGWQRVHHPDHLPRVVARIQCSLASGEPWEDTYPLRQQDGAYRWFLTRVVPMRGAEGGVMGWLGTSTDITERLEAERAAREGEERFRRALEVETVGVLFFTTDGQITYANDAFLRMAGYTRHDVVAGSVRWDELTPPEWMSHSLRAVDEYLATGRTTPYEKQYVRKDGTRWWGLLAATRLNEREGVEFVLDITGRKQAEEERGLLLERERAARTDAEAALQARDSFFANVTHDLRNPLGGVKGYAQLLRRRLARANPPAADWLVEGLEQIETGANKTVAIVDEILDLARYRETGRLELRRETFDLIILCRSVLADAQRAGGPHRFELVTSLDELVGEWDRSRLERVIGNLVGNAVKYSLSGGAIVIRVDREAGAVGDEAILSVQDHGLGIPAADLPRIFERFQRADNVKGRIAGTGIGLASARQIVEAHAGAITVESEEGVGSTFTLRIPVHALRQNESGGGSDRPQPRQKGAAAT